MSKETKNKKVVLLDAHAIIHRAYHALPDFATEKGEPTGALYGLATMIFKIVTDLEPDYIVACYDLPGPTHRHEVYKEYKGTRSEIDDALITQLESSKKLVTTLGIPIYSLAGFEADDMLGTIVEKLKGTDIDTIVASGDMDTVQLVNRKKVQVYTLRKGIKDTILYDEEAVNARFGFGPKLLPDYKGLRGDPSDNIIGVKGIGDVTASALIQNFGTLEEIYKLIKKDPKALEKKGIKPRIIELLKTHEDEAIFSKMLATIRRDAPIDFKLPEKEWKEGVNLEEAEKLFKELEFRTMSSRLKTLISGEVAVVAETSKIPASLLDSGSASVEEIKKISLAVSLLDSTQANPTFEEIVEFAKTDSFEKAREIILAEIKKKGLTKVYEEIELPLMPVVRAMEDRGIKINTAYLKKLSVDYHKRLSGIEKEIYRHAGGEFNVASPKQLSVVLFDNLKIELKRHKKTGGGAKSTKESELEKMRDMHPIIPLVLEHRTLSKLLGTYIDVMPALVDKKSRLHTTFLQIGAATGRMSSNNPNLQNIPIKTEEGKVIRNAFIPEKGFTLMAIDYSQIELRVAAFLSGDRKLIEIFKSGGDIHASVASVVFGVPKESVDHEMRRKAKVINFGIIYGMGVSALMQNLGTSREEAQKFHDDYFANFRELHAYLEKVKADAYRTGHTTTLFGRLRYFSEIKSKLPYIRAAAERMAANAPLQGTAADIMKIAMVRIHKYIKENKFEEDVRMLLTVHDELVFEVKEASVKSIAPKIKEIMEHVLTDTESKGVPIVANASAGDSWGGLEKMK